MRWREAREPDLVDCLNIQPQVWGDEMVGRERALGVWKSWTRLPSFCSILGEDSNSRKIAFGSSIFLDAEFATREIAHPRPGLNSRIVAHAAGDSTGNMLEGLAEGTHSRPLDLAVLSCHILAAANPEQRAEAEVKLPANFAEFHAGFRLGRLLVETCCKEQMQAHLSSGVWKLVKQYTERGHALLSLTKEDAFQTSGSVAASLFRYEPPVLGLRGIEKQLLSEAVSGETDQELAARMNLSLACIKKRWASIFDRVAELRPDLLPDGASGEWKQSRGQQKRHRILAYIRSHPEEVRPYRSPIGRGLA